MTKNKHILILTLTFMILCLLNPVVQAQEKGQLKMEYVDGYYYTMTGGNSGYMSYPVPFYTINNEIVYCIEPGVNISNYSYIKEVGLSKSPYSEEINKKIELIGHYGYNYPGHQGIKYRMAAQALIWNLAGNRKVDFWTEQYGNGNYINIEKEKQEIMELVNNHDKKPSFDGSNNKVVLNKEIILEDKNGVLSQFEISDNGSNEVKIKNNKIYITPKVSGNSQIKLIKKNYDNEKTHIFVGEYDKSNQKLGYFRASSETTSTINLNAVMGRVTIEKVDAQTGTSTAQGDASLEGAIYGLYDESDNLIEELVTDKYGKATSSDISNPNNLKLKEIKAPKGYKIDKKTYNFEITIDNLNPKIKILEEVISKKVSILKLYGSKNTGIYSEEANITFDIYLKSSNKFIKSITTDKKGHAETYLPFGTYLLKQKNTTKDYQKADDIEIIIDEQTADTVEKTIYNDALEGKLKVVKVDSETKKQIPIAGIKFKIKNLDSGEYVCQKSSATNGEKICEYATNTAGVLITPQSLVGNFGLEEVENQQVSGYVWNKEKIKFHIGDGTKFEEDKEYGKIYKIEFPNKRVKGKLVINKKGEAPEFANNSFTYEKINLGNVTFGIYAKEDIKVNEKIVYPKDTLVKEATTNKQGQAIINGLELGKYYVQELSTEKNHVLNNQKYEVELKYENQYTEIIAKTLNIDNYYKKGKLEFTKTNMTLKEALPNAEIEIYTDTNQLVYKGVTDEKGQITIDNLFIGKFYIVETIAPAGYVLKRDKIDFEIKENNQAVKVNMTNESITGKLEFIKVDFLNRQPLPNTKIEIYDESGKLIYEGITDAEGKVIVDKIKYGKYYIVEKEAPVGYILSNEKIHFEILENGETVKTTMANEREVTVPNTLNNDYLNNIMLVLIGIGAVLIGYAITKKKEK